MKNLTPMYAVLAVLLSMNANAQPPKKKPVNPPACDGLKSVAGKFTDNLKTRKDINKACQDKSVKQHLARLKKELEPCKDVHGAKDEGIKTDIFFPDIEARMDKACKVHDMATKNTDALCKQYDVATAKSADANQAWMATGESAQAASYARIAQMHAPLVKEYTLFSKAMTSNDRQITSNMDGLHGNSDPAKNVKDDIDSVMQKNIEKLKYQITKLVEAKVAQTKVNGNARMKLAGQQGDAGMIRFDNDEQVKKFSLAADACMRAAKPNGALDRFNRSYQNTVAKSLATSQIESRDLAKQFDGQAKEHAKAQADAEASSQHLARTEGNSDQVMADKANGLRGRHGASATAEGSVANGNSVLRRFNNDAAKAEEYLKSNGATWDGKSVVSVGGETYRVYHKPATLYGEGKEYYIPVR